MQAQYRHEPPNSSPSTIATAAQAETFDIVFIGAGGAGEA
jgi:hypothetical protein